MINSEDRFLVFCEELQKWNKIHNLSGYKTKNQIYENIADSIYPLEFIKDFNTALDIGSGSGFPAILLAIAKEQSCFILIEPNNKKASFLEIVTLKLKLKNVRIIKDRIENLKKDFEVDLITSRALFQTQKLINLSVDFLNEHGNFLFYKGSKDLENFKENKKSTNYITRNQRLYFYKSKKEV